MAKVQRKAGMTIDIRVNHRDGSKMGHFELTSGNLYYYRKNAKDVTAQYTWRQLIKFIENDLKKEG